MFMIDDFANKYMTDKSGGDYIGSDWGGRCKKPNSLYDFLQRNIFDEFPYVKMTLFLVVGRREAFIENGKPSVSRRINEDPEFEDFLRELAADERFELAYHGCTHGELRAGHFTQEWLTYSSLEEACQTVEMGKDIYYGVTGGNFYGGKYCGYESNEFSDASIAQTGFEWWCRHWDGALFTHRDTGVEDLEPAEFQGVVDIPSTVNGALFSLRQIQNIASKSYLRGIYYLLRYGLTAEGILDGLVKKSQIINIQEHSSPMREDEKHQMPNVVDDISNLQYILRYLKRYDLWYATGHEIAEYWKVWRHTSVTLDNERVVVAVDRPETMGGLVWVSLSESDGTLDEGLYLRSDDGRLVTGIKSGKRLLFEIPLTREQESFLLVRR